MIAFDCFSLVVFFFCLVWSDSSCTLCTHSCMAFKRESGCHCNKDSFANEIKCTFGMCMWKRWWMKYWIYISRKFKNHRISLARINYEIFDVRRLMQYVCADRLCALLRRKPFEMNECCKRLISTIWGFLSPWTIVTLYFYSFSIIWSLSYSSRNIFKQKTAELDLLSLMGWMLVKLRCFDIPSYYGRKPIHLISLHLELTLSKTFVAFFSVSNSWPQHKTHTMLQLFCVRWHTTASH